MVENKIKKKPSKKPLSPEERQKQTDIKIAALTTGFVSLNQDFVELVNILKVSTPIAPVPNSNPSPGNDGKHLAISSLLPGLKETPIGNSSAEPWLNLLAGLLKSGQSTQEFSPESSAQMVNTLKMMDSIRQVFLSEIKSMVGLTKELSLK